jgi:hypothetical protein
MPSVQESKLSAWVWKYSSDGRWKGESVLEVGPQSTYRGRGEIGGVYMPSQLEFTPQLCLDGT